MIPRAENHDDEIERLLSQSRETQQPVQTRDLAAAVADPAFDVTAAESALNRLMRENRAYFGRGGWYPGPISDFWRDMGY